MVPIGCGLWAEGCTFLVFPRLSTGRTGAAEASRRGPHMFTSHIPTKRNHAMEPDMHCQQ
eukprot:2818635-Amphidinium_carterae.1